MRKKRAWLLMTVWVKSQVEIIVIASAKFGMETVGKEMRESIIQLQFV